MTSSRVKKLIKKHRFRHTLIHFIYSKTARYFKYRKQIQIKNWVKKNTEFIKKNKLPCFYFDSDNGFCDIGGVKFLYSSDLSAGLLGLEYKGVFEPAETNLVLSNLKENSVFFDIGANFGYYSLIVAKNVKGAKIHSFEPVKTTFNHLKKNIDINKFNRIIKPNCLAVSDKEGEVRMTSYLYSGDHIVKYESTNKGLIPVKTITIDKYIEENNISNIDFIKCDIEGAELLMLKGAVNSLRKFKPKLLLELNEQWTERLNYNPKEVIDLLKELNYEYQIVGEDKKIHSSSGDLEKDLSIGNNLFFYSRSLS